MPLNTQITPELIEDLMQKVAEGMDHQCALLGYTKLGPVFARLEREHARLVSEDTPENRAKAFLAARRARDAHP